MTTKFLSKFAILTLVMLLGLMPGMSMTAQAADEVKYLEGAWDETAGKCLLTEKSTDSHTQGAGDQKRLAAELLNREYGDEGERDIDHAHNHRKQHIVGNAH